MKCGKKFSVPFLEMDLAFSCDLACSGCTHYSNYGNKGHVSFDIGGKWLRNWAKRLTPDTFSMLGGEPMFNPDLLSYLRLAHELWPESERVLISNGLNHARHPQLFETLATTHTRLDISFHSYKDVPYLDRFNQSLFEIEKERHRLGFKLGFRPSEFTFYRTYQGEGAAMRPYAHNDPLASWTVCLGKQCMTLHRGLMWKCPPLAFLELVAGRFGLDAVKDWQPYLAYQPLAASASDVELGVFLRREEESCCAMCPTRYEYQEHGLVSRLAKRVA
ncbi:MAG: radical SAM protein [Alphaproteobacteria bacterium]|nr:radical SAM protein [Alphaproteobacteria bacterium]